MHGKSYNLGVSVLFLPKITVIYCTETFANGNRIQIQNKYICLQNDTNFLEINWLSVFIPLTNKCDAFV